MADLAAWAVLVLVLAAVGVAVAGWLAWTATRLDRMHLRAEATVGAVRQQLLRRSAVAAELASGGLTDPASALVLLDAARRARDAEGDQRWIAESDLTAALRAVTLPPDDPLTRDLLDASRRVALARRIHNDVAAGAMSLRARRRVRWFRLAGRAPAPTMLEFDDRLEG